MYRGKICPIQQFPFLFTVNNHQWEQQVNSLQCLRGFGLPVTGADAEAATLGEISQVLLSLFHVLVDLVQTLLHTR